MKGTRWQRVGSRLALIAALGLVAPAAVEFAVDAPLQVPLAHADAGADADADKSQKKSRKKARRTKKKRKKRVKKRKICRRYKGKRRCRWVPVYDGHGVAQSKLRTEPLPRPSGDIHLYAVNFREELTVNIYDADGNFDDEALAQLDHALRCRRTGDERAVDPRLYEILSIIYDHYGRVRLDLVSGFRNQENEKSRHFHASAVDIRVPGISTRKLTDFAASLDAGGMGVGRYPTSDFVHIDYRAPGEKSYRWTDYNGPGSGRTKKRRKKSKRKKKR